MLPDSVPASTFERVSLLCISENTPSIHFPPVIIYLPLHSSRRACAHIVRVGVFSRILSRGIIFTHVVVIGRRGQGAVRRDAKEGHLSAVIPGLRQGLSRALCSALLDSPPAVPPQLTVHALNDRTRLTICRENLAILP